MAAQKPILISGGGLGSLLFAQSLRKSNIPFQIFERDSSFDTRAQGYRLLLTAEGLAAVESVLGGPTWELFWNTCGKTTGSGFQELDAITGERTDVEEQNFTARGGQFIGIARGDMRKVFMKGCEDSIQFGKKVTGYERTQDSVRVVFEDGTKSDEGSMLVGGEGIYSKVAKQLSGGKLKTFYTGSIGIHGQAFSPAFKSLGEGVFRIVDSTSIPQGRTSIVTNVRSKDKDDPNVKFGWTMSGTVGAIRAPNDDLAIIGKQAADVAKKVAKDWHPKFQPLFDDMIENDAAFWRITCSSPSGVPEWENDALVTVVGDAAHSMTPAAGLGANTALRDAELLGRLVREAGGSTHGVTEMYEKEMRVYASAAVSQSYQMSVKFSDIHIDEKTTPVVS